jgi:ribosomal protein L16 Arg81 hydroxylase
MNEKSGEEEEEEEKRKEGGEDKRLGRTRVFYSGDTTWRVGEQ